MITQDFEIGCDIDFIVWTRKLDDGLQLYARLSDSETLNQVEEGGDLISIF